MFVQFFPPAEGKKRREGRALLATFGGVVMGHRARIPAFSHVSGKCQGSRWYESVSWPVSPWILFRFLLLSPALTRALSDFPIYSSLI